MKSAALKAPVPLLAAAHPVDWWFVFKFNATNFPGCKASAKPSCLFGGQVQQYSSSQQFVYASSESRTLQEGASCLGDSTADPVGATFDQIYNGTSNYVVWNDQFYDDPMIAGCNEFCASPWGHSKGMLAWDEDGNTLGCVKDDSVLVSQHFFALRLTRQDVVKVVAALANASVVTDPANLQVVRNGGPAEIQQLVSKLGAQSTRANLE